MNIFSTKKKEVLPDNSIYKQFRKEGVTSFLNSIDWAFDTDAKLDSGYVNLIKHCNYFYTNILFKSTAGHLFIENERTDKIDLTKGSNVIFCNGIVVDPLHSETTYTIKDYISMLYDYNNPCDVYVNPSSTITGFDWDLGGLYVVRPSMDDLKSYEQYDTNEASRYLESISCL